MDSLYPNGEMLGKLIGRRPVLDDDVDILKTPPEVLRYHA